MKIRRRAGGPRPNRHHHAPPASLTQAETEEEELRREAKEAHRARMQACREDVNEFAIYIGPRLNNGKEWTQEELHEAFQFLAEEHPYLILMSHPESGKALPLDTEIPTPDGWQTMGTLEVGDRVFGRDGKPCRVTFATPVQHGRTVYEIEFDDGVIVKADADHRWLVRDANRYRGKRRSKDPIETTTLEMLEKGVRLSDGRSRWRIPTAEAVQYEESVLPIHPYVLGAWLGDGAKDCARITFHEDDREIWDRCVELEGGCEPKPDKRNPSTWTGTVGGSTAYEDRHRPDSMRKRLSALGLIRNKHIPSAYKLASIEQRFELLAGLLDTDGDISNGPSGGSSRVEFTNTNERLALDVLELARSLGFKATIAQGTATLEGEDMGPKWRVTFTARRPVFYLDRKRKLQKIGGSDRTRWRSIVAIREVESVPVRCIQVDSEDHTFLMGRSYTVTHNTTQLAVIRTVHELGNNPNLRFAFASHKADSKGTAAKVARQVKELIESSPEVAEVFPELVPGGKWEEGIFTVRRSNFSKDPSVQVVGYKGTITGSRIDRLIADDLIVLANTQTPAERAKFDTWITTILDRMTENARAIVLCNAWHPRDYAHAQERDDDSVWHVAKIPVKSNGEFSCSFWNEDRLADARKLYNPLDFARIFFCRARDDGESPFDSAAVKKAFSSEGEYVTEAVPFFSAAEASEVGAYVACGVDLAISQAKKSHRTAFTVAMKWPEDATRQVLWGHSARLRAEEIADFVVELDRRYSPIFVVENNAAQRWIIDVIELKIERDYFAAKARGEDPEPVEFPVIVPFTTGRNKAHSEYGVEGLAAEVAGDRWLFPVAGPETVKGFLARLKEAMLFYTRGAHTPDELMSLWFAREGLRRGLKAGRGEEEGDDHETPQVRVIGDRPNVDAPITDSLFV